MKKRFGALSSSTDPMQLATTVKGVILSLSSVIILVAGLAGLPLADSQIAEAATAIGLAVGGLVTLYGLLQKVVVHFSENKE